MKKHSYVITVSLIIFTLIISINQSNSLFDSDYERNRKEIPRTSIISDKIYVNNNWTETKSAGICTGDGTESNPYTLKNLVIDAGGIGHAIHIENTTEYFKIEKCMLFNSGSEYHDSGIKLVNVTNGQIINNTMYDNSHGMSIWSSLNLIITWNRFFNVRGLQLLYTNDSIFYLNTFKNSFSDISLQWSSNQYNSQETFSYTYNGRTYTNYLGNYWSIYTGSDDDGDGIGDIALMIDPYVVTNPNLRDYYPLIEPISAYSNIQQFFIPGFNLISFLGVIGIITILLVITIRKSLNKSKIVF